MTVLAVADAALADAPEPDLALWVLLEAPECEPGLVVVPALLPAPAAAVRRRRR